MGAVVSAFQEPMLVMEYMEYGSLHDLLRNETFIATGDIIMQILRDITQGLRYLHASKPAILHGDLKSKNILIDSRFRAKVCDIASNGRGRLPSRLTLVRRFVTLVSVSNR
jgi:serine/threonine protein kinase